MKGKLLGILAIVAAVIVGLACWDISQANRRAEAVTHLEKDVAIQANRPNVVKEVPCIAELTSSAAVPKEAPVAPPLFKKSVHKIVFQGK